MSEEKIMSEEAINELINGFEIVGSLTEYGRKNIKYHFQRLQKENEQLQNNWNELKEYVQKELKEAEDDFAEEDFIKVLDRMQELENRKV